MDSTVKEEDYPLQEELTNKVDEKTDKKYLLLKIISLIPGIRYRDLLRMTNLTNGTLSYHLSALEKHYLIRVLRFENSNITRYYPHSTSTEDFVTLGYLKMKTCRQILMFLYTKKNCTFSEIVSHIDKAPSTTSWNLKRLDEANILIRTKSNEGIEFSLKNPKLIERLLQQTNNSLLDRAVDNYISLINDL
jgi:predicted transcriptional regulator